MQAASQELRPPGFGISTRQYLTLLWNRRDYLRFVPATIMRGRQMNSALGSIWYVLNPVLSTATYYLIFGLILKTDRGVDDFLAFLTIGVFVYGFTQRCTTSAATSLTRNKGVIRTIIFPRMLLPLTSILAETLTFLPGALLFTALSMVSTGTVTIWLFALPLVIALQALFNTGLGLWIARLNNATSDIENILPFVFRLIFYGSGVLFSINTYLDERYEPLFLLNPMYCFIETYRWLLLDDGSRGYELLAAIVWTLAFVISGFIFFRRAETSYGR